MNEIVVLKLVTGEEVIAKRSLDGIINIYSKPRTFHAMQDPQTGEVRAGLMPWFMSDPDAETTIDDKHIIGWTVANSELERVYLSQTSKLDLSTKIAV